MTAWPSVALGDLCEIKIGRTPSRSRADFWGDGYPWLSIADMNQGRFLSQTKESITPLAVRDAGCKAVESGTVLLSFKLSIGKVGIAKRPLFTNEAIAGLPIVRPDLVTRDYLYWALRNMDVSVGYNRAAMGATLNKATLQRLPVPLAPLSQQLRIAEVLDRADALRAKRRETLALLYGLTQAIFLEMFGDPVVNPHSWSHAALGSLMETRVAKINPIGFPNEPFDLLSIPAYDIGHPTIVHGREIGSMKQIVQPNDVLLSKIVPHIRRAWIVPQPRGRRLIASGEWMVFRDSTVEPLFLQALFVNNSFHRNFLSTVAGVGGSLLRARPAFVAQLLVPLPPLELQRQFAQRLRTVAEAHAVADQHSAGLDSLFASLQQRAFAGRL